MRHLAKLLAKILEDDLFQIKIVSQVLCVCWCDLNQSIALKKLYNFGFWCEMIGRSIRPQIHDERPEPAPSFVAPVVQLDFAGKRFILSKQSQKTFDRAFKELSNGV